MVFIKRLFIFILLVFGNFLSMAQNQLTIDSLMSVLDGAVSDKEKVDIYVKLATEYIEVDSAKSANYAQKALTLADEIEYTIGKVDIINAIAFQHRHSSQYSEALKHYNKALVLSKQGEYPRGKAKAYRGLGSVYYYQGNYNKSIEYFSFMLEAYKELGDSSKLADGYYNIGVVFRKVGNYEKSLEYQILSLKMSEALGDKKKLGSSYNSIGLVYLEQGDYELALKYYLRSIEFSLEFEDKKTIVYATNNIGIVYEQMEDYDKALSYYSQALKGIEELESHKRDRAMFLHNIGNVYQNLGQFQTSLEYQSKSLKLYKEIGSKFDITYPMLLIGTIYRKQSQWIKAKKHISEALKLAQEIGYKEHIIRAHEELALVERALGNYKAAYENHVLFKQVSDSMINQGNIEAIVRIQAEYEFGIQKDSIQFANQKEKLFLNQKIQSQQNRQYAIFVSVFVLLVVVYILYRYYKIKQKANKLLQEQNQEITRQKKELEEMDQFKSRFFANISHELRTPLTLISAPLESLLERPSNNEIDRTLPLVIRNTKKLKGLVNDILDLSKLETKNIVLEEHPVNLHEFLKRIYSNYESMANQLSLDYEISMGRCEANWVLLDENRVEKVINNLIFNAIKYTPNSGKIETRVITNDQSIEIMVIDTGQGIAKEDLPYIFERYYQSKQPDAPIQGGTGIGLALAHELTYLMGGELTVESEPDKGSTFTLSLPLKATVAPRENEASLEKEEIDVGNYPSEENISEKINSEKQYRILIVEDNLDMRTYINDLVRRDHVTSLAISGEEALEVLSKGLFDLVITDVMMPGMDGLELLQHLRQEEQYQSLPVIMLTALNEENFRMQALNIGVDEYLTKPFSPDELLARVSNMLERYRIRSSMRELPDYEEVKAEASSVKHDFISQVEHLILAELENEAFNLEDAADHFHLGERHFRYKITEITGLSPKKYQREIALQKARELLEGQVYNNLSAVAYSVGIRNVTRFSKYYRHRFGKDPRAFFEQYM